MTNPRHFATGFLAAIIATVSALPLCPSVLGAETLSSVRAEKRVLKFSPRMSAGVLYIMRSSLSLEVGVSSVLGQARGDVTVPANSLLWLRVSDELVRHPEILDSLPEDAIAGLSLSGVGMLEDIEPLVEHLSRLNGIRSLDLARAEVSEKALAHLKSLQNLEHLSLWECDLRGTGFKDVRLPKLTRLIVQYNTLDPKAFEYISRFSNLIELNARRTRATDEAIPYIARLKKLTSLRLSANLISGKNFELLKPLSNLDELDLFGTPVVLQSILKLRGMNLKHIYLPNSLSKSDVIAIEKAFPKTAIVIDKGASVPLDSDSKHNFAPLH